MMKSHTLHRPAPALGIVALWATAAWAQPSEPVSAWQEEKCQIYAASWTQALDFFGTDNLNYNFIAQNENFIASGCTSSPTVCAQSNQELEIANALTIAMMNAGTASTFLPFRCETDAPALTSGQPVGVAPDAVLCRSQLALLLSGNKLTQKEAAVYEAQCACLESNPSAGIQTDRAQ
jgi:hypothetical protein